MLRIIIGVHPIYNILRQNRQNNGEFIVEIVSRRRGGSLGWIVNVASDIKRLMVPFRESETADYSLTSPVNDLPSSYVDLFSR